MAQSPQVEQILNLATALYRRGAIPEALAIAREVFVSLLGRDELTAILPDWIRSLHDEGEPPAPVTGTAVVKAMDSLELALDAADSIRAVTNICTVQPFGAAVAERALLGSRVYGYRPGRRWRRLPTNLRSPAIGWEMASPVVAAVRQHGGVLPVDFTRQLALRLPDRVREALSADDIALVNAYARGLREQGHEQPGIRLAAASAVAASEPVSIAQVVEIVRPEQQITEAAELFEQRGYPTEAVNVLINSIHHLPVEADEWQQLREHAERWLAEHPGHHKRSREQRSEPPVLEQPMPSPAAPDVAAPAAARPGNAPPEPPKEASEPEPDKSFFFLLKGDQAFKDQVVRGQDADLYFCYDVPSLDALASLAGKSLDELGDLVREGESIEIGVFIKPVGLTFRGNGKDYQIARIENNELKNRVCFKLRARDELATETGIHVVLTYNGAEVFQAFVRIGIVEAIDRTSTAITQLAISRSTFDLNDALPRDLTAFITTDPKEGKCRVSVRVGRELPWDPDVLDPDTLATAIVRARDALGKVADSAVFSTMKPGRWAAEPGQEPAFRGALCRMMSAGSALYKVLSGLPATRKLVEAIDALHDGARISIFTDSAFVPWEIVFPRYFFSDAQRVTPGAEGENFLPALLWGTRFEFETVLMFSDPSDNIEHTLPVARRQPGPLNVRIGVGSVEPEPVPGTPSEEAQLNAMIRHRAYCDANPAFAHWLDGSKALKEAFANPDYDVSLLYLMCHGKSNGTGEELDFGAYRSLPEWLNPERAYPGWPVVFINSCSIASLSPHVFDSFLRRFREKNAFGLIASAFPVPTRFATLFGCTFLEGYRSGLRVGELLLQLRRQLLQEGNPLAFFYALQCPLDVQCPEQPKQP